MKRQTLEQAVFEAERFIVKASELLEISSGLNSGRKYVQYGCDWPRQQGAAKRSSLDLTRKLADLRLGR